MLLFSPPPSWPPAPPGWLPPPGRAPSSHLPPPPPNWQFIVSSHKVEPVDDSAAKVLLVVLRAFLAATLAGVGTALYITLLIR